MTEWMPMADMHLPMNGVQGNIFVRDQAIVSTKLGMVIKRDLHNFHHVTLWHWGWWLVIARTPDGQTLVTQNAAKTYRRKNSDPVPYYFSGRDLEEESTYGFVECGEPLPDGALQIPYKPYRWWCLIRKDVRHSFIAAGLDSLFGPEPGAEGACVYSHRNPQDGDVVQEYNGWGGAYV